MPKGKSALQMYTVRDEAGKDFRGTFRRVAEIGYTAVELAGTGGLSPEELRDLCGGLGLTVMGTHTGVEAIENDFAGVVRLHHVLGARHVTVPSLSGRRYPHDEAGFRRAAADLGALGARLAGEGLALAYHNHAHEFFKVGDRYGLDLLYEETDPAHLGAELDVYWVKRGGADPAAFIRKLGPRCSLIHVKDMAADGSFAEVGAGTMDFEPIFAAADAVGSEWYIVEQDVCKERPPFEAIALSLENLQKWGRA